MSDPTSSVVGHEHHRPPSDAGEVPLGGAAQLRRAGAAAAGPDLLRGRPRDDGRFGCGRVDDHGDRRGEGPRRRGARRVPDAGQPAHGDPGVHRGADRHQQLHGPRRPTDRDRAARVPGLRGRVRPRRAQRTVRRRVPPALRARAGTSVAEVRGARHREARAARDHPRRSPQLQAVVAGQGVQLDHDAQPPCALGRPGHGGRPARPDGAARRPRRPHPRGAPDVLGPGQHRPAPQAPPRRGPAPLPRRLPLPRRPGARPLRRDLEGPPHPRAHLLHVLGDPDPDGRDGRPRRVRRRASSARRRSRPRCGSCG